MHLKRIATALLIFTLTTSTAYTQAASQTAPSPLPKPFPQNNPDFNKQPSKIITMPQNALTMLRKQNTRYHVNDTYEEKLKQNYLNNYFKYWTIGQQLFNMPLAIQNQEQSALNSYIQQPGWGPNKKPNSKKWAQDIVNNANIQEFPNISKRGITLQQCRLRSMPTDQPSYGNPDQAGQGYPFDNLQVSTLSANQPLFIFHTSKDKKWAYVAASGDSIGWVKFSHLAYVSPAFIKRWSNKKNNFITINKDNLQIKNRRKQKLFLSHMGSMHPVTAHNKNFYTILIAYKKSGADSSDKQAWIGKTRIEEKHIKQWPAKMNSTAIATRINRFIDKPYGWGGIYGFRDCSETQKDIFSNFAIWLPRHSTAQAQAGIMTSLSTSLGGMSNQEKKQLILSKGIPFFTLINTSDHVLLYIGKQGGEPIVFHAPWGLHTLNQKTHKAGRIVIGRSVITKLDLGEKIANVSETWLSESNSFSYLVPVRELIKTKIQLKSTTKQN